jgi:hypothetical protein
MLIVELEPNSTTTITLVCIEYYRYLDLTKLSTIEL